MSNKESIPYDSVCKIVGKLFIEYQFQMESLRKEAASTILDLQQKLRNAESKLNGTSVPRVSDS